MKLYRSFSITQRVLAALAALAATYAFFFEYLPPFQRVHIFSDIEGYHYPLQWYAFQSLKSGHFPQWDPSIYCGISFAGNIQAALFYPLTWLMYAAAWRHAFIPFDALQLFALAHVAGGGTLCYLWLRGRRLDVLPSVLGAGVFGYGGYMVSQMVHLGVVTGLAWMPLGLWGVDEAVARRDWRPLWKTALASALCFLAGYPPSWVVFCATVFFYALAGGEHWRAAAGVCAAVAGSALLTAVQMIPALGARSLMLYGEKYGGGVSRWSALAPFLVPNWFDYNRRTTAPYPNDAVYVYLGLAGIFAIAWALRRGRVRPYRQALIPAAFCLLLATNPMFLVYRVITRIPFLTRMVQSYNFYEGVTAMAALITAISLQDFFSQPARKTPPRWAVPLTAGALTIWSIRQLLLWRHGGTFPTGGRAVIQTAIAVLLFSAGLWIVRAESGRRRAWMIAVLLLGTLIDYKVYGTSRRFNTGNGDPDRVATAHGIDGMNDAAFRALEANRSYRIALDEDGSPYSTDLRKYGLATPQGFDPFLPAQYHDEIERWVKFRTNRLFYPDVANESMMQALGVRYVISHEGAASDARLEKDPNYRRIGPDDSYYRVYEYRHARAPYGWENGAGRVRPVEWEPERRVFEAHSDQGGRFYFVEQFYPGWSVTIDGRTVPIERWRDTFQSIPVAAGDHRVVFEYHERHLALGAMVSLAGLAGLILVILSDRRQRKPVHVFRLELRLGVELKRTGSPRW